MTTETTERAGGRARGPRGLARAWATVLGRPRRFFRTGVGPGDQAPGLTFAAAVAAAFVLGWVVTDPGVVPGIADSTALSAAVVVLLVTALAAPVGLHLTAAVATVSLIVASLEPVERVSLRDWGVASAAVAALVVAALATPLGGRLVAGVAAGALLVAGFGIHGRFTLRDRGGVSETVQVVAYASAPMALAGPPIPALRIGCGAYAALLLLVGLRTVHGTTPIRTLIAGTPPALAGYGVGYRVVAAVRTLFGG